LCANVVPFLPQFYYKIIIPIYKREIIKSIQFYREMIPTTIESPRFQATKIIGKGGFCRVYEGTLKGFEGTIAIKAVIINTHLDIFIYRVNTEML
jgi:hypothetical protein